MTLQRALPRRATARRPAVPFVRRRNTAQGACRRRARGGVRRSHARADVGRMIRPRSLSCAVLSRQGLRRSWNCEYLSVSAAQPGFAPLCYSRPVSPPLLRLPLGPLHLSNNVNVRPGRVQSSLGYHAYNTPHSIYLSIIPPPPHIPTCLPWASLPRADLLFLFGFRIRRSPVLLSLSFPFCTATPWACAFYALCLMPHAARSPKKPTRTAQAVVCNPTIPYQRTHPNYWSHASAYIYSIHDPSP